VTLTVTDSNKLTRQASTTATVNEASPTANAGGSYSGTGGSAVSFTATDPNPADVSAGFTYLWIFGDGATSNLANPTMPTTAGKHEKPWRGARVWW
jgi:hypothetical protein